MAKLIRQVAGSDDLRDGQLAGRSAAGYVASSVPVRTSARHRRQELVMSQPSLEKIEHGIPLPPEEPGPFAPCVLLLDPSSSMSTDANGGRPPIDELNEGIDRFATEIQKDSLAKNRADIC